MKLLNGDIWQVYGPLQELSALKLPVRISFQVAKLSLQLQGAYTAIDKVRLGLVEKHQVQGATGPDGHPGWAGFVAEFAELMAQPSEMEAPEEKARIVLSEEAPLQIEPRILIALERFVTLA